MARWGKIKTTLEQKPYLLTLALAGILVLLIGLAIIGIGFKNDREEIEIIETEPEPVTKILVDVGGAVIKPGIYEFSSDSRTNDALIAAGGLAEAADRDWVSQNLNLAAKLTDGGKIYVPWKEDTNKETPRSNLQGVSLKDQININTASSAELETIWGIGPATAQKIIDSRPYSKIEELLDKKIVKTNVYEAIKDKITVL